MNFLKYIKEIGIILLTIIIFLNIFIYQNKITKLEESLNSKNIQYTNLLADSDSLKLVSENLYEKMSFINYSDSLSKIENEQLKKKLKGTTQQIVNLEFKVKTLNEKINLSKPDSVIITENNKELLIYNFSKVNPYYKTYGYAGIYTSSTPDSVSINFQTIFNPVKLNIYTKKIDEYKYSIYVNTDSDFLTLTNVTSYISIDKPKTSILSKFNMGLGIGVLNDGEAFISGNLKYTNHNFGLLYSGNNGRFGGQYIYFIK